MSGIKGAVQSVLQTVTKKAIELAPDRWVPGGVPDPLIRAQHGLIGTPVSRVDGPLKVTGKARFAAEFSPDGMAYGALVYSTVARGRIISIDTTEAEASDGVVLIMTHHNAPKMKAPAKFLAQPKGASGDDLPVMQDDQIHWNGQPVALVLANTQEQADHSAALIRARYEVESSTTAFGYARSVARQPDSVLGQSPELKIGDAEATFAAAPHRVDLMFRTPLHNHNAIEPHAVTVAWIGDDLRVHDASQGVVFAAWTLADVFGLDETQVHVTSPYVGGGFGGKTLWQHHILAVAAAKLAGRPVRLALSREGVYRVVGGRASTEQRVAIGAQSDGKFDAIIHTGVSAMGRHSALPEPFTLATRALYAADAFMLNIAAAELDMLSNTFMRAPGESVGTFALECAIDELAEQLGMDPIALRLRNEPQNDPTERTPFSSRNLIEAYRMGAERFEWSARAKDPGTRREGEWQVGLGVASCTYPYHRMPGGAARLRLTQDGRAIVEIAAQDMGMGTETVQAQITAERLGLPMDRVSFSYGDSRLPGVVLAGGSQQTAAIGAAVIAAQNALFTKLLELAGNDSPLAGLSADAVGGIDGCLVKLDDASCRESYVSILQRAQHDEISAEATSSQPEETTHWSMHSYGAMFCEARVNVVTGEVRISRFLGSFDCGRIMNPKTASSQFRGGIIMGLGMAMMEETQMDPRSGRIMNPSLAEYHVPVHLDVPEIDVIWTDIADPHAPMGAHGVGEIGITGVAAAVANAVYNATGKRVRDLPITLDKLL